MEGGGKEEKEAPGSPSSSPLLIPKSNEGKKENYKEGREKGKVVDRVGMYLKPGGKRKRERKSQGERSRYQHNRGREGVREEGKKEAGKGKKACGIDQHLPC